MRTVKLNFKGGVRLSTKAEKDALARKIQKRTNAWAKKTLRKG